VRLSVRAVVVDGERPPFLLVHGAANSAPVWTFWQAGLAERGWSSFALDLRGHGESEAVDLASTRMADYAADVVMAARQLWRAPLLLGWSMGGLVAMMAAAAVKAPACIGLGPSVPARTSDATAPLRPGTFGPEEYGILDRSPGHQPTMPDLDEEERAVALAALGCESRLARDERQAGILMPCLECPCLVVTGSADTVMPRSRYRDLPFPADQLKVEGASHWGLVLSRRAIATALPQTLAWLERAVLPGDRRL
jgi:pimeloyl-ACP methyl ester carboxylesterase